MQNILKEIPEELIQELSSKINLRLLEKIGKGGQKQVYKAENLFDGNIVVFKAILPSSEIERVRREIRAVKIINHDHIPRIISTNIEEVKDSNDIVWIIEEYIEGKSLREALNYGRKFSLSEIVKFIDTMLSILEITEANNIIHRDIKPENIIIDNNDKFWLIDFGIARHLDLESLTETNLPFGLFTIGYSASEQFRNRKREIDIRTDLFSLGVVSAEMLLGHNPYLKNAKGILEVIRNIENQPLPLLKIEGDSQFLMARFIKTLADNRISRRPRTVAEAKKLFEIVKETINL